MEHNLKLAAAAGVRTTADLTLAAIARVIAPAPRRGLADDGRHPRCLRVAANVAVEFGLPQGLAVRDPAGRRMGPRWRTRAAATPVTRRGGDPPGAPEGRV